MHRRICRMFIVFVCTANLNAQIPLATSGHIALNDKRQYPVSNHFIENNSDKNNYTYTVGTPFFIEAYKSANIKLKTGRVFANVKARIDLVIQETYFTSVNGIEINIEPGMVKEITLFDTTDKEVTIYKLQTGFPPIDMKNGNNFYLLLVEGKCNFVKSIFKKETQRKDVMFGEVQKDYETFEEYYLFAHGEMKKLKRDKNFILAEFSDKQVQVSQFMETHKLNIKNNDQLVRLIEYYNTL